LAHAIFEDRKGTVWFGGQGLHYWQKEKIHNAAGGALDKLMVNSIAEDLESNLWVGTESGGLFRLRDDQLDRFSLKDGLSSEEILSLYVDSEGAVWIGTARGGLNYYHGGTIRHVKKGQGLLPPSISGITEDDLGNLWLASYQGIFRAPRQQ